MRQLRFRQMVPTPILLAMLIGVVAVVVSPVVSLAEESPAETEEVLTFDKDVLPVFRAKCFRCHAGVEPKGGLNLSQPSLLLVGGESGPALRIAAAEFSLLYEKISSDEMPAAGQKLTAEEKGIIRRWINDGAIGVDRTSTIEDEDYSGVDHWSFNSPVRPEVPQVSGQDRVRTPIDAFVLRKLEAESLTLAAEADRLTLLRRATFDLIGLPPTPEQVKKFLADDRPDSYAKMIDRLLDNPHYGERWGRHWLDVAGYTDSAGVLSSDLPLPLASQYRDYVIRAFNADKPYDRFLQEQIAGDELTDYWTAYNTMESLPAEVVEGITATGFLRTAADASRPDFSTIKNAAAQYYYPTMFDTLQIVCSTTMGLTIQCARCHSHKFDPIPQVDYYRMQAVFMTAYRPDAWIPQSSRRLKNATKQQEEIAEKKNFEVDASVKLVQEELASFKKNSIPKLHDLLLAALPEPIREDVKSALATKAETRNEVQKYLFEKLLKELRPEGDSLEASLKARVEGYTQKTEELNQQVATAEKGRIHFGEFRALYDQPGSVNTALLLRGDPLTPGPDVEPGVISTLGVPEPFDWTSPAENAPTSGRRLAFARWLTQPAHPLTARVMVNRIWAHHFGRGLVSTPEDFGVSGSPPSHPELLDWLATEFVQNGWSIKQLHREILLSSTWRQQSRVDLEVAEASGKVDPDNRLLWRQNLQRLEAESFRDAVHATCGILRDAMFGSPDPVARLPSGEVVVLSKAEKHRRSIYIQVLRLNPETMLLAFDQPEMTVNCTKRGSSTVSTQALTLLNSDAMVKAANSFATQVLAESPDNLAAQAVLRAFSRPATVDELKLLAEFLEEQTVRHLAGHEEPERAKPEVVESTRLQALADLCHMLLCANEFAYIN